MATSDKTIDPTNVFHPELRRLARRIPRFSFSPWLAKLLKGAQRLMGTPKPPVVDGLVIEDVRVPGPVDNPSIRIRLYRPHRVRSYARHCCGFTAAVSLLEHPSRTRSI